MNKVFKVVFNAVRNKMMVVNEMTSSMQVGRKKARVAMVVGAALLGLGGTASAAVITSVPSDSNVSWEKKSPIQPSAAHIFLYVIKDNYTGGNEVQLTEGTTLNFTAGYSNTSSTNVNGNSIKISGGGFTNSDIYGGYVYKANASVGAQGASNTIEITGGTFSNVNLYGGYSFNGGSVTYNQIEIIKGTNSSLTGSFKRVFGGYHGAAANVSNNIVTIDAPDATFESVFGGNLAGNWNTDLSAKNNVLTIISGKFQLLPDSWNSNPVVAGGWTDHSNNSENNQVIIQGGTFGTANADCLIVGGYVSDGKARGNSVSVSGDANLQYASLYGGMKEVEVEYGVWKCLGVYGDPDNPNILNIGYNGGQTITPWKGSVKSIQGFDVINFNGVTWEDGATLVNTTHLELNNTKITVTVTSGTITADSESMTLIHSTNAIEGDLAADGNTVTLYAGIANSYSGTIQKDGTSDIKVNLTKVPDSSGSSGGAQVQPNMNEQILVLGESRAAATAFTNQATDLIDSTLDDLGQKATLGMAGFAALHGNASEYETGSHIDVNGWSMIVGASSKLENGTTVGAFFETGTGNYRTFNDLDGVTMRGDGESTYWGGGLLARHAFDNGFYAEGSVRVGKLENELKNAVKGSQGLTGYDIDTLYFGAHIGAGKVFELNSAGDNVDIYTKFLYTYNEGKKFAIDSDSVNYSSVTSERLRLGARYTKNVSDKLQAKVGAAWEYDFNGDSKNTVANYDLGTPSLGGSTFMADVGVRYQAAKNVSVDFSGRGYTGQRDGVSGQVNVKFSF